MKSHEITQICPLIGCSWPDALVTLAQFEFHTFKKDNAPPKRLVFTSITMDEILALLPATDCRYIMYRNLQTGKRFLIHWGCANAKIRLRMLSASCTSLVARKFDKDMTITVSEIDDIAALKLQLGEHS